MTSARRAARLSAGSSATRRPRGRPSRKGNPFASRPGQSGNPAGVPKDRREAAEYVARRPREEFIDQVVDALKVCAARGSATHLVEALDRMAGKVPDKAELTGEDGDSIQLRLARRAALVERLRRMVESTEAPQLGDGIPPGTAPAGLPRDSRAE